MGIVSLLLASIRFYFIYFLIEAILSW